MNYSSSSQVNQQLGRASESGIKFVFKWLAIGVKALAEFIKTAIQEIIGKWSVIGDRWSATRNFIWDTQKLPFGVCRGWWGCGG